MKSDWCNISVCVSWHSREQWRDLRTWLIDNVDERDYELGGFNIHQWRDDTRSIYFAKRKDAAMFALRWA